MRGLLLVVVATSAFGLPCAAQEAEAESEIVRDDDPTFEALAPITAKLEAGDREGARASLAALLAGGLPGLTEGLEAADAEARLDELATVCGRLEALEQQRAVLEDLHARRAARLPADHAELLDTKLELGITRHRLGDIDGALAVQVQVHEARERILPADHPDLLRAKEALSLTYRVLGRIDDALPLLDAVHAARERLLPADHEHLLRAKGNLALLRYQLGDLDGAYALLRAVHAAWEVSLNPDHPHLLTAKGNLAAIAFELGELETAHALFEAVHAARARLLPSDHPGLLRAKGNLALTSMELGDVEGSLALQTQVYAAWKRLLSADHPDLLNLELNLATARRRLGDLEGARDLIEAVHAARERLLPPDHTDLLSARLNLATIRKALGDISGVLELEESVRAAYERRLPAGHPDLLQATLNLAETRKALGDLEVALELEEEVHAALADLLPSDHHDLLTAKLFLAETRVLLDDREGAAALTRAIAGALPARLERALTAAPRAARETARQALEWLARARFLGAGMEVESFEVLENARFVATSPLLRRLRRAGAGPEVEEVRSRLARAEKELDQLIASGPEDAEEERWRAAVRAAALGRDRAQRELLVSLGTAGSGRLTAAGVAGALAPAHVAFGITKLDRFGWDDEKRARVDLGPHYLAFVLVPRGTPRAVDLGEAARLERLVQDWRAAIGTPIDRGVRPLATSPPSELDSGRALRSALVDPLLNAVGDPGSGTTLHVCLDDALFMVPIDALPMDEGVEAPEPVGDVPRLGDLYRVRYELSMDGLVRRETPPTEPPSVLAVGGVDFDAELGDVVDDALPLSAAALSGGERSSSWGEWSRLSATGPEISELEYQAQLFMGVDAELVRGAAATEDALRAAVAGKRYVHFATHGWFLPESVKSMLDDEGRGEGALLGTRETVTGFAPLALCGLVLSGANTANDRAQRSARLLTAQELSAFDLSACDLAVLSACETNVGIHRAGQGIQSLQTALHMAGARSSITSLWSVQDWPTQSLMKHFYDGLWRDELGKADALWTAKCKLRREGVGPRVWAGWVLAGDPD